MKNIIPNSVYQSYEMEEGQQAYGDAFLLKVRVFAILIQAELINWFSRTPWKISFYHQLGFFTTQTVIEFSKNMALQLTQRNR